MIASLISRIQQILDIAVVYGRKVAPVGRSIEKNVDMALELGYLYPPAGTLIEGITVRFEGGRAVEVDADVGGEALRGRTSVDEGARRLGEVALVDREGRIGPLGTVFYNTLLDENAASHLALGGAYETLVGKEDVERINRSELHLDFMIGSDEVSVTGITRDGDRVPVLRDGAWQV